MDTESPPHRGEDHRDAGRSRQSLRSAGKVSPVSIRGRKRDTSQTAEEKESYDGDRARTRTRAPDQDQDRARTRTRAPDQDRASDGGRRGSSGSSYSEDYENVSPSERTLSPYSRTPSPGPRRAAPAKRVSSSPIHKTGFRRVVSRPQRGVIPTQRWGTRSQSKDSTLPPPKELDLVTKRMLSARLLKINELRNALAELQLRTDELQKENRVLRQLQVRQEKALQRYDDTESEISQLLSRHGSETQALRERLRRAQGRERAAERRLKDTQEQLQRSQAGVARLRRLAEEQELGPREELTRRLEQEKARALEDQRRVKELERSVELSSSSYQRQLAAERRRTLSSQEEVRVLQEELERLNNKLKEKERELDVRNIYANRLLKLPPRRDPDSTKKTAPSKSCTKAVQTEDRKLSLDFPSPPPAITDGNEYSEQAPDDYLSLKELDEPNRRTRETKEEKKEREEGEREQQRKRERQREVEREREREKEEKLKTDRTRLREGWEKEEEETKQRTLREEENRKRRGLVQEEVERRNQEVLANQAAAEEERRRKEHLLAKLREIDRQNQGSGGLFPDIDPPESSGPGPAGRSPTRFSEPKNQNPSIFSFTEPEEAGRLRGGAGSREGGRRGGGEGGGGGGGGEGGILSGTRRRGVRAQSSSDDLAFGHYAPSFGRPAPRGVGFPPPPTKEERDSLLGGAETGSGGSEKEKEERWGTGRKSSLMHQLFGAPSSSPSSSPSSAPQPLPAPSGQMDVLHSPPTANAGQRQWEGLLHFDPPPPAPAAPPPPLLSTLHVAESRPAVRAIPSFDDDIEELTL